MIWLDPTDLTVIAAVVGHGEPFTPEEMEQAEEALQVASDVLTPLSAYLVHPEMTVTEQYRPSRHVHRLTPTYRPLKQVVSVSRVIPGDPDPALVDPSRYSVFAQNVYLNLQERGHAVAFEDWWMAAMGCRPRIGTDQLEVVYVAGSTITAAARRALLFFARQLYLGAIGDDECQLPERTTSLVREGVSYTIFDPAEYLDQGKTGLPQVDQWLASVNPDKARRPSGVWTPDSPPGVNRSVVVS